MRAADVDILMVPGRSGSGPDHWQTRWQRKLSTASRVAPMDWDRPDPDEWQRNLIAQAKAAQRPVVLVAHGSGVFAVVRAAPHLAGIVRGAFLVAPPHPAAAGAPGTQRAPAPSEQMPFPSILVASRSDPHASFAFSEALARDWHALLIDAGDAGHIDGASGHGPWPEGLLVFSRLLRSLGS